MFRRLPTKLMDCQFYPQGVGAELFIVEGDSASNAVGCVRDSNFQAVIPMQGKPLNAWRANKARVASNEFYSAIVQAIGAGFGDSFRLDDARYQNIVLVFDPDADGIHCGMLVLMFFYRWMLPLLESGRVYMVHAPLFEINSCELSEPIAAMSDEEATECLATLQKSGSPNATKKRFRGLASMGVKVLKKCCIDPSTRHAFQMRTTDAKAAIEVFCPKASGGFN